jgi:peroxisomal enoyl-CoA hydratase 2
MKFEHVQIGAALPRLVKPPVTTRQLVEYAGASGDFNRIHYDEPFAREGGFPSVIAHGMLSMGFFGELLAGWAGVEAVARLQARFKAVTFPGDVITVEGAVVSLDAARKTAELALTARNQKGVVTLEGSATVKLE